MREEIAECRLKIEDLRKFVERMENMSKIASAENDHSLRGDLGRVRQTCNLKLVT